MKLQGTAQSRKNIYTAAILCAVGFLGIGGLHYFYVGRNKTGQLYLFTFGLLFIGTIIDLILILLDSFRDSTGAFLKRPEKPSPVADTQRKTAPQRNSVPHTTLTKQPLRESVKIAPIVVMPVHYLDFRRRYHYRDVRVAGYKFYDTSHVKVGMKIALEHEPTNEYDPNAISVSVEGKMIGHMPKNSLQDMYFSFLKRGGTVIGKISRADEETIEMALGYYMPELEYEERIEQERHEIFKLTANKNQAMQDNISCCSVGDEVYCDYDADKEKYVANTSCGEIGCLPKGTDEVIEKSYVMHISNIYQKDTDKNIVEIAIFY